jgi:hypothetical protein
MTEMAPPNCVPQTVYGCTSGDTLKLFTLLGDDSTMIYQPSSCGSNGYTDFTGTSSVKLGRGRSYSGSFTLGTSGDHGSIWIDFNDDGQFTPNERVLNNLRGAGKNVVTPFSIHIPSGAPLGNHKLRIRIIYSGVSNPPTTDPCNLYVYSETEDYTINIDTPAIATRVFVSNGAMNNCMPATSITMDANTNNNTGFVDIIDDQNNVIAAINANGNNLGTVTTNVYINNGSVRTAANGLKLLDRNITISPEFQPTSPVTVRLYLKEAELQALQNADPSINSISDIEVTKTNDVCGLNGPLPVNGMAIPQINNGTIGTDNFIDVLVTGFSTFYINRTSRTLPVTIASFSGERVGSVNRLNWVTSTETSNKGFEVQRSSDGINFTAVAFVNSKAENGTSTNSLGYSHVDERPLASNNYYRLKQVNIDGRTRFSNIISIKGEKVNGIAITRLYPNPANSRVNLIVAAPWNEQVVLIITDVAGKVIKQQAHRLIAGDNMLQVDVANLPKGSFFIKAICNNGCMTAVSKFIKE